MGFGKFRNCHGIATLQYFKVYINNELASYHCYGAYYSDMKSTAKGLKIAPLTEKQVESLNKLIMKYYNKGVSFGSKVYRKSKKDVTITWEFSDRH